MCLHQEKFDAVPCTLKYETIHLNNNGKEKSEKQIFKCSKLVMCQYYWNVCDKVPSDIKISVSRGQCEN